MKYKVPLRTNQDVIITQDYASTENAKFYLANGLKSGKHNGMDIICGDSKTTYGTPCVCPYPEATVVKVTWDSPLSTKGNGVTIEFRESPDKILQTVFWHTGEIAVTVGQKLKEGDIICYIGNSGLSTGKSNINDPFSGAHLHFMVFEFNLVGGRYVMKDATSELSGAQNPRNYHDFSKWYAGVDTGAKHDIEPLRPFLAGMNAVQILAFLKRIFKIK